MQSRKESYQFVVCGGGLAGFCAAVSAARNGIKTCLVHDRPVFGGNSSSEIKVAPHGAARFHTYARETGVISELLIEELFNNHAHMGSGGHNAVWDRTLYSMAMSTPNLTFYMNTTVIAVMMSNPRKIESVLARIANAEVELLITADIVADCTGDGVVANLAGCEWRLGTESRSETGEPHALIEASSDVMGSSMMFNAVDTGKPAPFTPPDWAAKYDDASFFYEKGHTITSIKKGYWWIAISLPWRTIHDNEEIRHELTRHVLGVWDWIKNKDPLLKDKAANMALDWMGQIPGKRESRRIMGQYLMTENDALNQVLHHDEVAYGGWYVDVHSPEGILDQKKPELTYAPEDTGTKPSLVCGPYGIPLRILVSKDVDNLMMAGRNVSVTHTALGTVRVMLTTAVMGQAVGTAAAISLKTNITPNHLHTTNHAIHLIQQQLLKDGCFLPHAINEDPHDLARLAVATSSSDAVLWGMGPDSKGYVADLRNKEKNVDHRGPLPGMGDELKQRLGQWIAIGANTLEQISVCLSNKSEDVQSVHAQIVTVDHIWDYRVQGGQILAEVELKVKPGTYQWVTWDTHLTRAQGLIPGHYVRLDLLPNSQVTWHCAGAIQPGMMSAFDIGDQMRRYKYGRTLSFRVEPVQACYAASNVLSGVSRPYGYTNLWRSDPNQPLPQWIQLTWDTMQPVTQVDIIFSGHIFREFEGAGDGSFYRDAQTVKDYRILAMILGEWQEIVCIQNNYQRHRIHKLQQTILTDQIQLQIIATNGDPSAAVYEMRCY